MIQFARKIVDTTTYQHSKRSHPSVYCPPILLSSRPVLPASSCHSVYRHDRPVLVLRSRFDELVSLEEKLMLNPLTRGKGFKGVKLVKGLLGTNSIYGALVSSHRKAHSPYPLSPERGLGNVIKERAPRKWVMRGDLRVSVSPERSSSHLSSLPEIAQYLYPCLCVGSFIWLCSLPELREYLNQSPTVLDISVLR